MQSYHDNLILQFDDDITGNAASNQLVTVFDAGTTVKPALFDVFGSPIANPVTTDSKGNYSFSIANGTYDIVARQGTPDETRRDEFIISVPGFTNGVKTFDTLALAIADAGLDDKDSIETTESTGGKWDAVPTSGVTTDEKYIFQSTGSPTIAIAKRDTRQGVSLLEFIPRQHWAGIVDNTNIVDMTPFIQNAIDSGEHIKERGQYQLNLRMDSPIFLFGGGVNYDFGFANLLPTAAFGAIKHKTFTTNQGKYTSGEWWNIKNVNILGPDDESLRFDQLSSGIEFDVAGPGGITVYKGNIENIFVRRLFRGVQDKLLSGSWMTTWKHIHTNFCPVGFAKSVGTSTILQNCYFARANTGIDIQFLFGFDILSCAVDAGEDRAVDNLLSRVLINDSEGNIEVLRAELNAGAQDIVRIVNSDVNIGILSLSGTTLDATSGNVSAITVTSNSNVNIRKIVSGDIAVTGANTGSALTATSGAKVDLGNTKLPTLTGTSTKSITNFGAHIYSSIEDEETIVGLNDGYFQQTKFVNLFLSASGDDTNTGLNSVAPLQTLDAALKLIKTRYLAGSVTINLTGGTSFSFNGQHVLDLERLYFVSTDSSTINAVVSGGVTARILGPRTILVDGANITFSAAPTAFLDGILFPSSRLDVDYSIDNVQLIDSTIVLPENAALAGAAVSGVNGLMSVGVRGCTLNGDSVSTSLIVHLSGATAQVTEVTSTLTNVGLTNGTQITTSNLFFG